MVISAATVMLIFVCVIGFTRWNEAKVDKRIAAVDVQSLREAGDYFMQNRAALLEASRRHEPKRMWSIDAVILTPESPLYEEVCPNVIKQLKPSYVYIYNDHVLITFSVLPRMGIYIFGERFSVEKFSAVAKTLRKLGDRVWQL